MTDIDPDKLMELRNAMMAAQKVSVEISDQAQKAYAAEQEARERFHQYAQGGDEQLREYDKTMQEHRMRINQSGLSGALVGGLGQQRLDDQRAMKQRGVY